MRRAASCCQPRQDSSSHAAGSNDARAGCDVPIAVTQPSSRRITGKRASAIAIVKPDRFPERRRRGAGRVRAVPDLGVRLDGGEATLREVVADRRDERLRQTLTACRRRRRDARDDGRQRRSGQLRVEVARPQRPRIGRQRAELGVCRRFVVEQQDLGVAAEHTEAAAEQLELARRVASGRRPGLRRGRERVVDRPSSSSSANGLNGRAVANGLPARPRVERVERGSPVGANGLAGAGRRRRAAAAAQPATGAPPSSRARRPPSSRTSVVEPGSAHGGISPNPPRR